MEIFKKRPTALLCFIFILTSVTLVTADVLTKKIFTAAVTAAAVLFTVLSFFFADKLARYRMMAVMCAVAAVSAALISCAAIDDKRRVIASAEGSETHNGTVTEVFYEKVYGGAYAVRVKAHGITYKTLLETEFSAGLSVGDEIEFTAETKLVEDTLDGKDELYYLSRGVIAYSGIEDSADVTVTGEKRGVASFLSSVRRRIAARLFVISEAVGGDNGMMSALLTGDRSTLSPTLLRDFKYIGAVHLLAVSGLHLSVLIGGLEALLRKLLLHKNLRVLLLVLSVIVYMGLTGFSSSVMRAGIMLIVYYMSFFFGKEPDRVTALFLSVALIIAASPFAAAETGLLLSFSAMLACIYADHVVTGARPERGKTFLTSLLTSVYALIFTLPVMWIRVGNISWLSPLATLVLSLPVTLILYLSPFAVIFYKIAPISELFAYPAAYTCRLTARCAELMSNVDGAVVTLPDDGIVTAVAVILTSLALCAVLMCKRKTAKTVSILLFTFVIALGCGVTVYVHSTSETDISYFRQGKNEVITVRSGTSVIVCDITDGSYGAVYGGVRESGASSIYRIDAYMLTHLHQKHIRSVGKLCGSTYVEKLLIPMPETNDELQYFTAISAVAERYGVPVETYARGDGIAFGSVSIRSDTATIKRSTHPVVILSAESPREEFLYVSSSVHESELLYEAMEFAANAKRIIFGIHGPVMRSSADYGASPIASVTYANGEVYSFLSPQNPTEKWEIYAEK